MADNKGDDYYAPLSGSLNKAFNIAKGRLLLVEAKHRVSSSEALSSSINRRFLILLSCRIHDTKL